MNKSNNIINWVNISKGIAILLVVYGHVIDGLYDSKIESVNSFVYEKTSV